MRHKSAETDFPGILQRELGGISPRKKLIVAVSGGADSVALLHLLIDAGYRNLVVAHFNHLLRGKASDADAEFVRKLAANLELPFVLGEGDVQELASARKCSVETAAREARYGFLAWSTIKYRTSQVALAHHADDQVETCLFNFLRGSGIAGLSGMKPRSKRIIDGTELELLRPLLPIPKAELLAYLKARKIRFREDATNTIAEADSPTRNKLRLKVLPLIEELLGPSFKGSIVRNARLLADEEELLSSLTLPIAVHEKLSVKVLRDLHPALRRRVLHTWLKHQGIEEPGFAEVERVASLLESEGPAKVNLPGNRHARRRAGVLFIE
ncbi:MAG: tRNA lysidine(34) synthetase TilS [Proteobacteria bacterium]|nr:tRNA lysidine(34) synthetase TilS [Pseudomonadota bacterium]